MPRVHGFHPVREALRHRPHEVSRVWIAAADSPRRRELVHLCERHGVELLRVSRADLRALVGPDSQGFGAELTALAPSTATASGDPDLVVLLEDVQDPRNLGAVLRVCDGAGVASVAIRDRGSAPLTPTVVKASAGATEGLAVERVTNAAREIERRKADGFWVYGAHPDGVPPWEADLRGKVLLCFGGEGKGLRRRTRESCDVLLGLPMLGRVDSLNVATAAAAILYEARRQRS